MTVEHFENSNAYYAIIMDVFMYSQRFLVFIDSLPYFRTACCSITILVIFCIFALVYRKKTSDISTFRSQNAHLEAVIDLTRPRHAPEAVDDFTSDRNVSLEAAEDFRRRRHALEEAVRDFTRNRHITGQVARAYPSNTTPSLHQTGNSEGIVHANGPSTGTRSSLAQRHVHYSPDTPLEISSVKRDAVLREIAQQKARANQRAERIIRSSQESQTSSQLFIRTAIHTTSSALLCSALVTPKRKSAGKKPPKTEAKKKGPLVQKGKNRGAEEKYTSKREVKSMPTESQKKKKKAERNGVKRTYEPEEETPSLTPEEAAIKYASAAKKLRR